jgi:phosphatidylserine/phosphatidylglycerophosphate/cardiolipin synthase-like enzyme
VLIRLTRNPLGVLLLRWSKLWTRDALLAAKLRGLDVALKTDKIESAGRTQAAMIAKLQATGVPVEVSEQARLLHHKFAVIDGRYVITGSFNWTVNAERQNRENLVVAGLCGDGGGV